MSLDSISGQWHEFETVTNAKQEINTNAIQHLGSAVQNFKNYILRTKDYGKKFDSELNEMKKQQIITERSEQIQARKTFCYQILPIVFVLIAHPS